MTGQSMLCQAHHAYQATQQDELTLHVNDVIKVTNTEFDTWWVGTNIITGEEGWFPSNFVMSLRPVSQAQPEDEKVVAAYDYIAQAPDELNLTKGDIVVVIEKEEGWWKGELNGKVGVFPANFVTHYHTTQPKAPTSELPPQPQSQSQNITSHRESKNDPLPPVPSQPHPEEAQHPSEDREVQHDSKHDHSKKKSISENFKLSSFGVKKGGIGGLFSGGVPGLRKSSHSRKSKDSLKSEDKSHDDLHSKSEELTHHDDNNDARHSTHQQDEIVDSPQAIRPIDTQSKPQPPSATNDQSRASDVDLPTTKSPDSYDLNSNTRGLQTESSDSISKAVSEIPIPKPTKSLESSSYDKVKLPPIPSMAKKAQPEPEEPTIQDEAPEPSKNEEEEVETSEQKEATETSGDKPSDSVDDPPLVLGRVIEDYSPESSGELALVVGDVITILEEREDTWRGEKNGIKGYFPSHVVEKIKNDDEPTNEEIQPKKSDFKLAAYGVKKGGLGGLFAGGMPVPRKTNSSEQVPISPVKQVHESQNALPTLPKLKPVRNSQISGDRNSLTSLASRIPKPPSVTTKISSDELSQFLEDEPGTIVDSVISKYSPQLNNISNLDEEFEVPPKPTSLATYSESPENELSRANLSSVPESLELQNNDRNIEHDPSAIIPARPDSIRSIGSIDRSIKRGDSFESAKSPKGSFHDDLSSKLSPRQESFGSAPPVPKFNRADSNDSAKSPKGSFHDDLSSKLSPKQESFESAPPVPKFNRTESAESSKSAKNSFQNELSSKLSLQQDSTRSPGSIETPSKRQDSFESMKSAKSHLQDEVIPKLPSKENSLDISSSVEKPSKRQDSFESTKSAKDLFQNELSSKLGSQRGSVHSIKSVEKPSIDQESFEADEDIEIVDEDQLDSKSPLARQSFQSTSSVEQPPNRQESLESPKVVKNAFQNELNSKLALKKGSVRFNPSTEEVEAPQGSDEHYQDTENNLNEQDSNPTLQETSSTDIPSHDDSIKQKFVPSLPSLVPTTPLSKQVLMVPITPTEPETSTKIEKDTHDELPDYEEEESHLPVNEKDHKTYDSENSEDSSDLPPTYDEQSITNTSGMDQKVSNVQEQDSSCELVNDEVPDLTTNPTTSLSDELVVETPAQSREIEPISDIEHPKIDEHIEQVKELETQKPTPVDDTVEEEKPQAKELVDETSQETQPETEETTQKDELEDSTEKAAATEPEPSPQPTILATASSTDSPKLSHATRSRATGRRAGRSTALPKTPTISQTALLMKSMEEEISKEKEDPEIEEPPKEEENVEESPREVKPSSVKGRIATPFAGLTGGLPPKLPANKPVINRFNPANTAPASTDASELMRKLAQRSGAPDHIKESVIREPAPSSGGGVPLTLQDRLRDWVKKELDVVKQDFMSQLNHERELRVKLEAQVKELQGLLGVTPEVQEASVPDSGLGE